MRVLRALAVRGTPVSATQLAKECGLSRKGVHLALESLAGQRIVTALGANKVQLFQLDQGHPLAAGIRGLFQLEQERWAEMLQAVRGVLAEHEAIQAAWYFGSVARGEDVPRSDFDLAVAVPDEGSVEATVESVRHALRPVEDRFYVAFSVLGLSNGDIARLHRDGDEWWGGIIRDAKVLKGVGPPQYLETTAGGEPR